MSGAPSSARCIRGLDAPKTRGLLWRYHIPSRERAPQLADHRAARWFRGEMFDACHKRACCPAIVCIAECDELPSHFADALIARGTKPTTLLRDHAHAGKGGGKGSTAVVRVAVDDNDVARRRFLMAHTLDGGRRGACAVPHGYYDADREGHSFSCGDFGIT